MRKIILFELNEVPFRVLDTYCDDNPNSTIANIYRQSTVAGSISPDTNWLHPWCTWPTLHRGVDTERHMLTNLSQDLTDVDNEFPPIWKILADNGVSVGLGGSLHSWPIPDRRENYAFYLPDTFATDGQAFPSEVETFQKFNIAMVDKSARNVSKGIALPEAMDVLRSSRKLGFGFQTARAISSQLLTEFRNPARKGRRRILQAMLAFDVFMKQLDATRPDFTTFFTNHVASSMHRYWVAKFPEDFANSEYEDAFVDTYRGEIDYAMDIADRFLSRLVEFVERNTEYSIVLTTSMGQAACQEKMIERQVYVSDPVKFMTALGVAKEEFSRRRVMAPRFAAVVNEDVLERLSETAGSLRLGTERVEFEQRSGSYFMFHFGQEDVAAEDEFLFVNGERKPFADAGLSNTLIEDSAGSTGYHIPNGILMVYNPVRELRSTVRSEVPTTEIAPMILSSFGIKRPDYMNDVTSSLI